MAVVGELSSNKKPKNTHKPDQSKYN